jgi:hypothetical protein
MYQPWPEQNYPPIWRVALAFLLAPGAAALLMALAMPAYAGLPSWSERVWRTAQTTSVLGAYPTAVVFGLPAYLTLRRHFAVRPFACVFVGSVIAALPWALVVLAGTNAWQASIDGRATVINGHTTGYGWLLNAEFVLTIGVFGAVGGLVFWVVAAAGHRFKPTSSEQQATA